jgi:hypothetical protein
VIRSEMSPGVRGELTVTRVIYRLHHDNLLQEAGSMAADVFHELRLLVGRTGRENRSRGGNCLRDTLQEGLVPGGVAAAGALCLMVQVLRGMVRVDHQAVDFGGAEMEDPSLVMIDPYHRMDVC